MSLNFGFTLTFFPTPMLLLTYFGVVELLARQGRPCDRRLVDQLHQLGLALGEPCSRK